MNITTEEMRYRKKLCEFALKYGVTRAAKTTMLTECLFIESHYIIPMTII